MIFSYLHDIYITVPLHSHHIYITFTQRLGYITFTLVTLHLHNALSPSFSVRNIFPRRCGYCMRGPTEYSSRVLP